MTWDQSLTVKEKRLEIPQFDDVSFIHFLPLLIDQVIFAHGDNQLHAFLVVYELVNVEGLIVDLHFLFDLEVLSQVERLTALLSDLSFISAEEEEVHIELDHS